MAPSRLLCLALSFVLLATACRSPECQLDTDCDGNALCVASECVAAPSGALVDTFSSADAPTAPVSMPCVAPQVGRLVLNEILADPAGTDANGDGIADAYSDEFVEVLNLEPHPVNLDGVTLQVGGSPKHVLEPHCLPAGESVTIFGAGVALPHWRDGHLDVAPKRLSLANTGARISLQRADGSELDAHAYGPSQTGSVTRNPDGRGSWEPHPESEDQPPYSPGRCGNGGAFPACEPPPQTRHDDDGLDKLLDCPVVGPDDLRLNEVLADPGLADTNGDGLLYAPHDEFVELVLVAAEKRRTMGVGIYVNGEERAILPDQCVSPGTVFVVFGGGTPRLSLEPAVQTVVAKKALKLPNGGGQLSLHIGGNLVSDVVWGANAAKDQSLTRAPDLIGDWVLHQTVSLHPSSPGRCADGSPLTANGCIDTEAQESSGAADACTMCSESER